MLKPIRARISQLDEKAEAEKLAALLPSLTLAAQHLANNFDVGVHGRRRTGSGEDFWQFKQYGPDDPTTSIDWRQSAKRENVFIRQQEQETTETVWIWCDNSPTMDYGSSKPENTKLSRSAILTLATALLLSRGGEKFGLMGQAENASTGITAYNRFANTISERTPLALKDLIRVNRLPRKSTVVLISDFLSPLEDLKKVIRTFVDTSCNGLLVHIADPAEVDLPFSGRTRFESMSHLENITLGRVESVRDEYHVLYTEHKNAVQTLATRLSWDYLFHRTDTPAGNALADIYSALELKGN